MGGLAGFSGRTGFSATGILGTAGLETEFTAPTGFLTADIDLGIAGFPGITDAGLEAADAGLISRLGATTGTAGFGKAEGWAGIGSFFVG